MKINHPNPEGVVHGVNHHVTAQRPRFGGDDAQEVSEDESSQKMIEAVATGEEHR